MCILVHIPAARPSTITNREAPHAIQPQRQRRTGSANLAQRAGRAVRLHGIQAGTRGSHRAPAGRAVGRGRVSDRRRQVAVLPDSGLAAARADAGRLAADRPDEGPDRRPDRPRHRRPAARFDLESRRVPHGDGRGPLGRAAAVVRRARAVRQRAVLPGDPADENLAVRRRRGALHLGMGPQLPPRLPASGAVRQVVPRGARAGPDGHRHAESPGRHVPLLRDRAAVRDPHGLLSCQPDAAGHAGNGRAPRRGLLRRPAAAPAGVHDRLRHVAAHGREAGRAVARGRFPGAAVSRRHGRRRPRGHSELVPGIRPGHRGGHDRLRHGHRQGQRPLRLSLQSAQEPGELRPGDRPRGPRRPAVDVRTVLLSRRPERAGELRLRRHAHARGRRGIAREGACRPARIST